MVRVNDDIGHIAVSALDIPDYKLDTLGRCGVKAKLLVFLP